MKNFTNFHLKTFFFLVVKFSVYLNRLVLVMHSNQEKEKTNNGVQHKVNHRNHGPPQTEGETNLKM